MQRLADGRVEFLAPQTMSVGETGEVSLELAATPPIFEQIQGEIRQLQEQRGGQVGQGSLRISQLMDAQLVGSDFNIALQGGDSKRAVDSAEPQRWTWTVEPLDGNDWFPRFSARRALHLTMSAIIDVDGAEHTGAVRTFDQTIIINVHLTDWLGKSVEVAKNVWYVLVAMGAALGWLLYRRKPSFED